MKTINFNALAKVSALVEKVQSGIKKASKFGRTLEGAKARLCNEWNNGYNEAVQALGFNKPSEFNTFVTELIEGHKLHAELWTIVTIGRGKNAHEEEVPALIVSKAKVDKTQSAKDINGTLRYLIIKDEKGHAIKEDVLAGIVSYTPDVLIKLVALHMYMSGLLADDIEATAKAKAAEKAAKEAEKAEEEAEVSPIEELKERIAKAEKEGKSERYIKGLRTRLAKLEEVAMGFVVEEEKAEEAPKTRGSLRTAKRGSKVEVA